MEAPFAWLVPCVAVIDCLQSLKSMCVVKRTSSFTVWLVLVLALHSAQAQEIRYVYDELGRLIAVMDEQGRTAIYEYDEVGNLLAIRRSDATGPVAITFFNPTEGPIGTRVEIFGIGCPRGSSKGGTAHRVYRRIRESTGQREPCPLHLLRQRPIAGI